MSSITEFLKSSELFRSVDEALIGELVPNLQVIELHDQQPLVSKGGEDQNVYLLISGTLRVIGDNQRDQQRTLFEVMPGQSIREMAILSDDPVLASVVSSGESRVLVLSRPAFEQFSRRHPQAALQVMESLSTRLQRSRLLNALHQIHPFDALEPEVISDLESELEMFTLYGGEILCRQGDAGDSLYILIRGRVRVLVRDKDGQEITVAELGAGELVGEMAVVTGESRSATVEAIRDTQVAKLTHSSFERFLMKHPRAAVETISRKLAQRLRDTTASHKPPSKGVSTIALIPSHAAAPISQVGQALKSALDKFGRTLHLKSNAVDEYLGCKGIAQTYERSGNNLRLVEWLNDQEIVFDYVLYEADPVLSPWTERCIRQADHILIVGDGQFDPAPGDIESELLVSPHGRTGTRQWLVLVHAEGNPSGTARWLDARPVERHFHVRLGQDNDFDRIARFLTGRAVGLTLGGGFARGLAHVGAFRACEELGISIDAIGGASMGAMIGAMWTMGWTCQKIVAEVCAGCAQPFNDLTFPFIAFKAGKSFSSLVRKFFHDVQIEDLWIPYFCISANLNRSELKIHTRGSLAKAVLATTRAPGVFPPVVYEGELHIDGGVINNVPVDIMKTFCNQGITIGVDVSPPHELSPVRDYGDEVSGWEAFWKRLNPFSKKHIYTPSILLVMIRTLEFSGVSYKGVRLKCADLYMHPDLLKFKRTDFHLADGILNAGYDCMRKNILQWLDQPDALARRPDLAERSSATRVRSLPDPSPVAIAVGRD
jgi:NTE family protein